MTVSSPIVALLRERVMELFPAEDNDNKCEQNNSRERDQDCSIMNGDPMLFSQNHAPELGIDETGSNIDSDDEDEYWSGKSFGNDCGDLEGTNPISSLFIDSASRSAAILPDSHR